MKIRKLPWKLGEFAEMDVLTWIMKASTPEHPAVSTALTIHPEASSDCACSAGYRDNLDGLFRTHQTV